MSGDGGVRNMKSMVWGFFLIALGGAYLLDRYGVLQVPVWRWWPVVLYVIAVIHVVERRPSGAVMFTLLGTWFLFCTNEWLGLTYHNSWPLLMVAVGSSMVVGALSGEGPRRRRNGGES